SGAPGVPGVLPGGLGAGLDAGLDAASLSAASLQPGALATGPSVSATAALPDSLISPAERAAPPIAAEAAPGPVIDAELAGARAAVQEQPGWRYLQSLPMVRVLFADAPHFGHQTASLSLIRRLRDLGYRGAIEGVYGDPTNGWWDDPDNAALRKLPTLIPGFDPKKDDQFIEGLDLRLRSDSSVNREGLRVPLALTGGADEAAGFDARVRADVFLHLSPTGWASGDRIRLRDTEYKNLGFDLKRTLVFRPEDASAPLGPREAAWLGPSGLRGIAALEAAAPRVALMPAYGLQYHNAWGLFRVLTGLSEAMARRPADYPKPVVVPVINQLYGLSDRMRVFGGDLGEPGARLLDRLRYADVFEPGLESVLSGLAPGQILLVETGSVPSAAFERLYGLASLPPILEGRNARNLMLLLGAPFFSRMPHDFAHVSGAPGVAAAFGAAAQALLDQGSDAFEPFAAAFAVSATAASRAAFAASRVRQDDLANDKLIFALNALADAMSAGRRPQ
ncbi:MAG TPA: hypothetical protein VNI01_09210, partial [Elusimicrobiota bacterium]|nr:hypothetical protein [Elusimicrobiota bacterium]